MEIIEWEQFMAEGLSQTGKPSAMTVGVFDGVHLGHQSLIEKIVARNKSFTPVVVTFRQNYKNSGSIQTFRQKAEMLESLGVEILIVVDFTEQFMCVEGLRFLEILLEHGNIGFFAAGSNFRCGYKLDTGAPEIRDFFASKKIPVEIVSEVTENSSPISSSRIRASLAAGDIPQAEKMLGRKI